MATPTEDALYSKIHRITWRRRVAGMLGAATLGIGLGAAIGAVAICLPWVAGLLGSSAAIAAHIGAPALLGVNGVAHAAAVFGAFGGFMGAALGAEVGANSGASTAEILTDRALEDGKAPTEAQVLALSKGAEPKKGLAGFINWKVALTAGLMFAAFGAVALMAAPSLLLAPATLSTLGLGSLASLGSPALVAGASHVSYAAIAAGSAIFGMFGATMGVDAPRITANLSNFFSKMLTGKLFEREPDALLAVPTRVIEPAKELSTPEPARALPQPEPEQAQPRRFAEQKKPFDPKNILVDEQKKSFDPKDIIAKREQPQPAAPEVSVSFIR